MDLTGGRNLGRSEEKFGDRGDTLTGIFIKNVIKDSPTGRTGQLATGDRIVEVWERLTSCQGFLVENYNFKVNGVELTSADHEVAVEAIQTSDNPIRFIVQSLQHWVSEFCHQSSPGGPG